MIDKFIRDLVNLLIYGGLFIGLCAACITAFTFELTGRVENNLHYILFIGVSTAALYCCHRVIGLRKWSQAIESEGGDAYTSDRYLVILKYKNHIWFYCIVWIGLSIYLFLPMLSVSMILWLMPAGIVSLGYIVPFLPGGKRLRDLGWGKIVMIGWSWAWLTAFIPLWIYADASIQMSIIHFLERMLFIILLTIPFEIRDISIDRFLGLITVPEKIGKKSTMRTTIILCILISLFSFIGSFHYFNPSYGIAMSITSILVIPIVKVSYSINDDYFFGGVTDGLMILSLWIFIAINSWL